jgi:hypothetical protein
LYHVTISRSKTAAELSSRCRKMLYIALAVILDPQAVVPVRTRRLSDSAGSRSSPAPPFIGTIVPPQCGGRMDLFRCGGITKGQDLPPVHTISSRLCYFHASTASNTGRPCSHERGEGYKVFTGELLRAFRKVSRSLSVFTHLLETFTAGRRHLLLGHRCPSSLPQIAAQRTPLHTMIRGSICEAPI